MGGVGWWVGLWGGRGVGVGGVGRGIVGWGGVWEWGRVGEGAHRQLGAALPSARPLGGRGMAGHRDARNLWQTCTRYTADRGSQASGGHTAAAPAPLPAAPHLQLRLELLAVVALPQPALVKGDGAGPLQLLIVHQPARQCAVGGTNPMARPSTQAGSAAVQPTNAQHEARRERMRRWASLLLGCLPGCRKQAALLLVPLVGQRHKQPGPAREVCADRKDPRASAQAPACWRPPIKAAMAAGLDKKMCKGKLCSCHGRAALTCA